MRRVQIYLDDELDDALAREATRLGTSKGALIRRAMSRDFGPPPTDHGDPWAALDGWLSDGGVDDIDAEIYEHR